MTKFSSNWPVKSTLTADQSLVKRALSIAFLSLSISANGIYSVLPTVHFSDSCTAVYIDNPVQMIPVQSYMKKTRQVQLETVHGGGIQAVTNNFQQY